MPGSLRKGAVAVVLPCFDMDAGIAPPGSVDLRPRISIARQARPKIIHREINRFGQARQFPRHQLIDIQRTAFDVIPQIGPA